MTNDEAKEAIIASLSSRPVTVDMVQAAASSVLVNDSKRLGEFNKWLERFGTQFVASLNEKAAPAVAEEPEAAVQAQPSGLDGQILGEESQCLKP